MQSLDELQERYRNDTQRLDEARQELDGQKFEGQNDDARISAIVTADGTLDDLTFDPRVFRTPVDSREIAEGIKLAYQRARHAAAERANELYRPILGPEFEASDTSPRTSDEQAAQILNIGRRLGSAQARSEYDGILCRSGEGLI